MQQYAHPNTFNPFSAAMSGWFEGRQQAEEDARKKRQDAEAEKMSALQRANLNIQFGNYEGAEADLKAGLGEGNWSDVVAQYQTRIEGERNRNAADKFITNWDKLSPEAQAAAVPIIQKGYPEFADVAAFGKPKDKSGTDAEYLKSVYEGQQLGYPDSMFIPGLKERGFLVPTRQVPVFGEVPAADLGTQTNPGYLQGGIPSVFDPVTRRGLSTAAAQAMAAEPVTMQTGTTTQEYLPPLPPKTSSKDAPSFSSLLSALDNGTLTASQVNDELARQGQAVRVKAPPPDVNGVKPQLARAKGGRAVWAYPGSNKTVDAGFTFDQAPQYFTTEGEGGEPVLGVKAPGAPVFRAPEQTPADKGKARLRHLEAVNKYLTDVEGQNPALAAEELAAANALSAELGLPGFKISYGKLVQIPASAAPAPATATTFNEGAFRKWYVDWARKTGISSNPDDPQHFYDYRAAFKAGAVPKIDPADKKYHWPSKFKKAGHPNLVVDGKDTRTGEPAAKATPAPKPPPPATRSLRDGKPGKAKTQEQLAQEALDFVRGKK